jgi:hypothetical protein
MTKTRHILVYRYEYWDASAKRLRMSDAFATFDAILKGFATPLLGTAKVAPNAEIFRELAGTVCLRDDVG